MLFCSYAHPEYSQNIPARQHDDEPSSSTRPTKCTMASCLRERCLPVARLHRQQHDAAAVQRGQGQQVHQPRFIEMMTARFSTMVMPSAKDCAKEACVYSVMRETVPTGPAT